jgi:hypothetical protein
VLGNEKHIKSEFQIAATEITFGQTSLVAHRYPPMNRAANTSRPAGYRAERRGRIIHNTYP